MDKTNKGSETMGRVVIRNFFILAVSTSLGLLGGGIPATIVIAWMNFKATDGPIFPAPMVAFFVVAPISIILFLVQFAALIYEARTKNDLGSVLLGVGLICGLGSGMALYLLVIDPYQSQTQILGLISYCGLGAMMGFIVFGFHWLTHRIRQIILNQQQHTMQWTTLR
jgi:hypothetical protein